MITFVSKMQPGAATNDDAPAAAAERSSGGLSRRRACQVLSGGVLGMVVAGLGLSDVLAGCRGVGEQCRRHSQCCSKRCFRDKCRRGKAPKEPKEPKDPESPPSVMVTDVPPAEASPPVITDETDRERRVTVNYSATMDIVDHESFTANERCHHRLDDASTPVLTSGAPTYAAAWVRGCGDEVRVELDLAFARRDNGDVAVSGWVSLFEGTSERTRDLDGQEEISEFIVPWNSSVSTDVIVHNEAEGGDYAVIEMTFRNVAA